MTVKTFPAIDRNEKVEISKGDLLNVCALLTSGGDAIAFINEQTGDQSPAGDRLARGCFGYVGLIFRDYFGVQPEDADNFIDFLAAEERERAKAAGVDMAKLLGLSGEEAKKVNHPRDSMH